MKKEYLNTGYFVDTNGIVYGKQVHTLRQKIDRNGYKCVVLREGRETSHYKTVHRLVAETFLCNPDNLPCVNHKDGNKLNNCLSNLEWCTQQYNAQHAVDLFGIHSDGHPRSTITNEDVHAVCGLLVDGYRNKEIADKLGICRVLINNIRTRKNWKRVSKDYDFPSISHQGISDSTFLWCCARLEEGLSSKDILLRYIGGNGLSANTIYRIRNRRMRPHLSKDFNF